MIVIEEDDVADVVSTVILFIIYYYFVFISLQTTSPQSCISLDNVQLVIDGDIENDEYITNAMETIKHIIM